MLFLELEFSIYIVTNKCPLNMEDFMLEASERHPEVSLRNGFIHIKGHSIPLDAKKLYKPVIQWVKSYIKDPPPHTEVSIQIDFYDCDSTKAILDILKTLAICQNTNHEIEIVFKWIYIKEDDAIKKLGEFLESKLDITFNYHEKKSYLIKDYSEVTIEKYISIKNTHI